MVSHIASLNLSSEAWLALAWSILWQSTLLAGAIGGVCWLLRRSSPAIRYWLWQIVMIKLLLMPFWTQAIERPTVAEGRPIPPATVNRAIGAMVPTLDAVPFDPLPTIEPGDSFPTSPQTVSAPLSPRPVQQANWWKSTGLNRVTWKTWLMLGWGIAVTWQLALVLRQHRRLQRQLRQTGAAADSALQALVAEIAAEIGLRSPPAITLLSIECSPFVCGVLQTRLVLPRNLLTMLDSAQLRQVLLHELAHVKRRDLLWGWFPQAARMVYFFHPVVYWVGDRIRLERELACDQFAMTNSRRTPAEYAETLIKVVSHASTPDVFKIAAASASLGIDGRTSLSPPNPTEQPGKKVADTVPCAVAKPALSPSNQNKEPRP